MADKPSRGLVLYGDGLVRYLKPSHTHLNSLACRGSCGFLSLPHSPPSDIVPVFFKTKCPTQISKICCHGLGGLSSHTSFVQGLIADATSSKSVVFTRLQITAESEDERIVREFTQLLDACEAYTTGEGTAKLECQKKSLTPTVSERFMGIKAAIITNNSTLQSFSGKLGLTVLQFHELAKNDDPLAEPPLDIATSVLLKLLGFQEGKALESSQFDLVFVHIGAAEKSKMPKGRTVANDIEYVNGLIGKILQISLPGSEIGSRLHLSVVMSYGNVLENDDSSLSVMTTKGKNNSDPFLLFPRQSYTMKGGSQRENVRHYCPLLIAQWQDAVTRKDMAETFSFKDFKEHGGNLTIPADRFLHELAFKLWKAPKYGA